MKAIVPLVAAVACLLCLILDSTFAAPSPPPPEAALMSFWDSIFNIPRSVINSVNKNLNESGAKCRDGSDPVQVEGKGTCHDNALGISRSAIDSVNGFLNG